MTEEGRSGNLQVPEDVAIKMFAKTLFKSRETAKLAQLITSRFKIVTMIDNDEIYIYDRDTGYYRPNGDKTLRKILKKYLEDYYDENMTREIIHNITASTYIERKSFKAPEHLIAVKNGVIELHHNPPTIGLHSPEHYITSVLPVEYNPTAICSNFADFLTQILPNEADRTKIQEGFGNSLWTSSSYMICNMLYGEGYNGKSTLLNVLTALLGRQNISNVSLQALAENRFAPAELYGKLANIYADIESKELRHTGAIKVLTGNDMAMGERKFKTPFFFRPYSKPWFSANRIPYVYDESDAFFRRWRIIIFKQKFPMRGPKTNPNMLEKLTTPEELSGILNWALQGLVRITHQKGFSHLDTVEERRIKWKIMSDSLAAFINDCIEYKDFVSKDDFHQKYAKYCGSKRLPVMSKTKVGQRLPALIPEIMVSHPKIGGKQVACWYGIQVKQKCS